MLRITKTLIATTIIYTAGALAPAPAAQAADTPAAEHAACVAVYGNAGCHDIECAESFGTACPRSGMVASTDPGLYLTIREARGAARRLFTADLAGLGLEPRLSQCHHTTDTRVACRLTLRAAARCRSTRLTVVETLDDTIVNVAPFRCGR